MRGAPQVGFSETIRKIKARTSLLTRFRPPTWLTLETHVQYERNPARCQFTTVLGVTKTRGFLHPDQNVLNATQNSLCRAVNRRRGRCACRASNCRRRARFSRTRSSRERKTLTNQPRKCRSDTIMARILAEKSESSLAPSHSFCRCTTVWRGTRCVGHRQARNGRGLASCRLSFVLDLEGALRKTRTTRHFKRSPRSDSQDVPGESRLGCTTDPRRTAQTRHRHRREQCQQIYGALPQTAVSHLAHLPGEPCPAAGLHRLLHRAHHPVPGPLRISGVGP